MFHAFNVPFVLLFPFFREREGRAVCLMPPSSPFQPFTRLWPDYFPFHNVAQTNLCFPFFEY